MCAGGGGGKSINSISADTDDSIFRSELFQQLCFVDPKVDAHEFELFGNAVIG